MHQVKFTAMTITVVSSVSPANTAPVVAIVSPFDEMPVNRNRRVFLKGTATDATDGDLSGPALQWKLGDTVLGWGPEIALKELPVGLQTISLVATDSDGSIGTASIKLDVKDGPVLAELWNYKWNEKVGSVTRHGDRGGSSGTMPLDGVDVKGFEFESDLGSRNSFAYRLGKHYDYLTFVVGALDTATLPGTIEIICDGAKCFVTPVLHKEQNAFSFTLKVENVDELIFSDCAWRCGLLEVIVEQRVLDIREVHGLYVGACFIGKGPSAKVWDALFPTDHMNLGYETEDVKPAEDKKRWQDVVRLQTPEPDDILPKVLGRALTDEEKKGSEGDPLPAGDWCRDLCSVRVFPVTKKEIVEKDQSGEIVAKSWYAVRVNDKNTDKDSRMRFRKIDPKKGIPIGPFIVGTVDVGLSYAGLKPMRKFKDSDCYVGWTEPFFVYVRKNGKPQTLEAWLIKENLAPKKTTPTATEFSKEDKYIDRDKFWTLPDGVRLIATPDKPISPNTTVEVTFSAESNVPEIKLDYSGANAPNPAPPIVDVLNKDVREIKFGDYKPGSGIERKSTMRIHERSPGGPRPIGIQMSSSTWKDGPPKNETITSMIVKTECLENLFFLSYNGTGLWWFNGEQPKGYDFIGTLTMQAPPGGEFSWDVTKGDDKVDLIVGTTEGDHVKSKENTIKIKSTNRSRDPNDVIVECHRDGNLLGSVSVTVKTPKEEILISIVNHGSNENEIVGYTSIHRFKLVDFFGDEVPRELWINEEWTEGVQNDRPEDKLPTTWKQPDPNDPKHPNNCRIKYVPGHGHDELEAHYGGKDVPYSKIPCRGKDKVCHWGGKHYAGSREIKKGVNVYTGIFRFYEDHGVREP